MNETPVFNPRYSVGVMVVCVVRSKYFAKYVGQIAVIERVLLEDGIPYRIRFPNPTGHHDLLYAKESDLISVNDLTEVEKVFYGVKI